jgi:UDP-N-acetylmuramyl-tripeptide synthetase
MTLRHLVAIAGVAPLDMVGDTRISGIEIDSRRCVEGSLFIAMPGTNRPSESFLVSAKKNGAGSAAVHSREGLQVATELGLAVVLLQECEEPFADAVWRLCDGFWSHPTRGLKVVGITGTNGKTTSAWLVRDLLTLLGKRCAYLGTLGFQTPNSFLELQNTTPFAVELYNLLELAKQSGVDSVAMEVSSHALAQHRVGGVEFDVALLTNLTQDHLDFHGSMEEYARAKHSLFVDPTGVSTKTLTAVFNIDDETGAKWAREQPGNKLTFGVNSPTADLKATPINVRVDEITLKLSYRSEVQATVPLGGAYNVYNCLSAVAASIALGYSLEDVASVLPNVTPVPGRFEPVANNAGISVLVDYAHTPDAIEKLLDSVREVSPGKIITVFGCGGDRDRTKRPKMAAAASSRSDLTVITSDNPRTEDPNRILDEVVAGIKGDKPFKAIPDRREAVAYAVHAANPGDVVVIAGKGHENYQIIGRDKIPMDDRDLAREALAGRV